MVTVATPLLDSHGFPVFSEKDVGFAQTPDAKATRIKKKDMLSPVATEDAVVDHNFRRNKAMCGCLCGRHTLINVLVLWVACLETMFVINADCIV